MVKSKEYSMWHSRFHVITSLNVFTILAWLLLFPYLTMSKQPWRQIFMLLSILSFLYFIHCTFELANNVDKYMYIHINVYMCIYINCIYIIYIYICIIYVTFGISVTYVYIYTFGIYIIYIHLYIHIYTIHIREYVMYMVYVSSKIIEWLSQKSIRCDTVGFTSLRFWNGFTVLAWLLFYIYLTLPKQLWCHIFMHLPISVFCVFYSVHIWSYQ